MGGYSLQNPLTPFPSLRPCQVPTKKELPAFFRSIGLGIRTSDIQVVARSGPVHALDSGLVVPIKRHHVAHGVCVVRIALLVVDGELVLNEDGAEVGAEDGPEDGHRRADGRYLDLEDDEEDALGPIPGWVVRRVPPRLVVDRVLDAPGGEYDDAEGVSSAGTLVTESERDEWVWRVCEAHRLDGDLRHSH